MKKSSLPLILIIFAFRGTLFFGTWLVFVLPCAGGSFGVFEATGSLATSRGFHTATLLPNGKVLVAGGQHNNASNALASAELYDPTNGTWSGTGSLATARYYHTATLLPNGKVLVAGGTNTGASGILANAELYDPTSGRWSATGSLAIARYYHTATLLPNGKVLVAGGFRSSDFPTTSAELYDPTSGTWSTTGNLATGRRSHTATLLPNGKVLVASGFKSGSDILAASAELYDPTSGTWNATGSLATSRAFDTATLLPNGKVLVAGGRHTPPNATIPSTELYDPASGAWTASGFLGIASEVHTATLLPGGKVLVAGGFLGATGGAYLSRSELYDPASGTWTATGFLRIARAAHTATLLPNGMVLIAGGLGISGYLSTAELYGSAPPLIISPLNATATVGQLFVYQFETEGATTLEVSNLPPGLTFNASLAAIIGIPREAGPFQVGLSARNSQGPTNKTLTLTVQLPPTSGPVIVSSTCATARTGLPFSFQLQASGGSSATYFAVDVLPPGLNLDPPTGFISGIPTRDGSFGLAVSAIDGMAMAHATVQLTFVSFTSNPTVPMINSPGSAVLTPGQFFSYIITADANGTFGYIGTDGIVHQGPSRSCDGLPAGLCFDGINTISGVFNGGPLGSVKTEAADHNANTPETIPAQSGGIVTNNVQLFGTDPSGTGTFPEVSFIRADGAANISTRIAVGTGANALIGGFIIDGSGTTKALIRAIGPSLAQFGVPNVLADPVLELHYGERTPRSNDNWRDTQENAIRAIGPTSLAPTDNHESAILAYLRPGSYTAIISGKDNSTGTALVEVYDLGVAYSEPPRPNARLANISTRGFVDGNNVMIGGFIIRPQPPGTVTRIVIRAIGPSLTPFGITGALQDPTLELRDSNGATLITNDNWQDDPTQAAEISAAGLALGNNLESGISTTLPPGGFTAILDGKNNTTGVALVEVYALP